VPPMSWVERFGRYLALAWLFLLGPPLEVYLRGDLRGVQKIALLASLAVYAAIFAWYSLAGHGLRDPRVPVVTVGALTVLAVIQDHLTGTASSNNFLIPLLVAGFGLPTKRALMAFVLVAAVMSAEWLLLTRLPVAELILGLAVVGPVVALFGGGAMGLRYLLSTLAELRAARAEIAQHAVGQERSRIARDLHDLLGHSLSLITLKGELATRLLPEGAPGVDEVRDMLGLSRQAMQQVREAVSGYRQPTLATELTAARVALKAAEVEVDVKQDVGALDRETEAVLGWVIREGCTNVIRHSGAKRCRIALTRADGQVRIEVTNDGRRVPQAPAGNGLRGLEERLATLGGKLDASALASAGFRLVATVPAHGHSGANEIDVEIAR
jgi:two-component system, NarL family, sensor histidine kinase DesK